MFICAILFTVPNCSVFMCYLGMLPGLYSSDEMSHIATQMMPGQVQTKRVDKIEVAMEKFYRHIRDNLHVLFSVNHHGENNENFFLENNKD